MAKKESGSSGQGRQAVKRARPIADRQLDFSDIPQSTDEELKGARRVGRPKSGTEKPSLTDLILSPHTIHKSNPHLMSIRTPNL